MKHNPQNNFYVDIQSGYSDLINQFNFIVIDEKGGYLVSLSNEKCIIELHDTEDGVEITIINPLDSEKYRPNLIFECLGNDIRLPWSNLLFDNPVDEYKSESDVLIKNLSNVLNGDFSWSKKYNELQEEEKKLVAAVMKLSSENPIKKSFRKQSLTWKEDARKMLA